MEVGRPVLIGSGVFGCSNRLSSCFEPHISKVKDAKHECSMGTITVPLSRLVEAKNMMLNEHFPIKNQGPCSTVKMKMALRVRNKNYEGQRCVTV